MKKTLLFVIASAALLALIISGCSKKNDATAATMKNVAGTYKLTAATGAFGGLTFNLYDSIPACQRDDNLTLNADSTYQVIDAGTQCNPPDNQTGTWFINGSDFVRHGPVSTDSGTIKSFNGSQLVVTHTDNSFGIPIVATETLTKIQ